MEAVGHVPAKLTEGRRSESWVPALRTKLAEHNSGALYQVAAVNAFHLGNPIRVAVKWRLVLRIAPTRRLTNDRPIDLVAPGQKPSLTGLSSKCAPVEEMLLYVVRHPEAELGIGRQSGEEVLGTAPGQGGGGALNDRVTGGKGPGPIHV